MEDKAKKLEALLKKKAEAEEKFKTLMKGYRGVIHESAMSELRHSEVKVMEDYLHNLDIEISEIKALLNK